MNMEENKYAKWGEGRAASKGLSKELGMEVLECEEGYCKGRIVLEEKHQNPYGWVHGGCSYALADTIAGIAACTAGNYVSTVNSNFHYIRTGTNTKEIICTARKVKNGRTLLIYEAELTNDRGEILAKGDFTYYNLQKKIEEFQ